MEAFKTIIWIINIFSSLAVIGLVLMQHGKGADAGANFGGSGSAQGVFGSSGNANFLTRITGMAATILFASCLALGYINTQSTNKVGGLDFSDVQQSSAVSASMPHAASAPATVSQTNNSAAIAATAAATKIALDKQKNKTESAKDNKKTDSKAPKNNKDKTTTKSKNQSAKPNNKQKQ